jgi:hypothetical protein
LRKYAEQIWKVPTEHFDPDRARNEALGRDPISLGSILVQGSTYARGHLKARLFKTGLKDRFCEMCGQDETWKGRRMALILDHINGVADDHRLENLRIVCPNCAATLDTHCGRQNRLGMERRDCLNCGAGFWPSYASQRYCSRYCGIRRKREGRSPPEQRKVKRPPYTHLLREIDALGYKGTGRRYGVSDNAIRKWLYWYEKERAEGSSDRSVATGIASKP